jgi:hypothetical protein
LVKTPRDYISIEDYYKVKAYAYLYKGPGATSASGLFGASFYDYGQAFCFYWSPMICLKKYLQKDQIL